MHLTYINVYYIFLLVTHKPLTIVTGKRKKNTLKIRDVERLTHEALDLVSKRDYEKRRRQEEESKK